MLVFIDESGDAGFKLEKGASPIFVVAMVIFNDRAAAEATVKAIEESQARAIHKPKEFKFSKCSEAIRDAFFAAVQGCPFSVRAIVVRKEAIYSPRLRADKERFYEYFVKQMMKFDDGVLVGARVVIDGSGDREFRRDLNAALRSKLRAGAVKSVRFKSSKNDPLVQLADMCAGAIARSYRTGRANPGRWRAMLKPRIDNVWEFR